MVLVYRAFKGDYPWPNDLVWNGLSAKLDAFQSWLLDQRSAEPQSPFFKVFDGFATFIDNLVAWFTSAILWLSWLGAAAVGTLAVLRFGGVRAAAIVASAFASFALLGLWEASMETLALMLARSRPVAPRRDPARDRRRAVRPVPGADLTRARRDADRPRVRLPDARRDPVLDRPRGRRRLDDGLRGATCGAHNRARDSRRRDEHRRGGGLDGRDAPADALEGAASRLRDACSCSASTRRSSSRSRWS